MCKVCKLSNETDFVFTQVFISPNINVISFKIVPFCSYTPMETLFPLLLAALEVFNWYGLQHVRYNRKNNCFDLLDRIANEQDFFSQVITGDESWIF
jgi:hypothetical protein